MIPGQHQNKWRLGLAGYLYPGTHSIIWIEIILLEKLYIAGSLEGQSGMVLDRLCQVASDLESQPLADGVGADIISRSHVDSSTAPGLREGQINLFIIQRSLGW